MRLLHKPDLELRIHHRALRLHRQAGREVWHIGLEVKLADLQLRLALAGLCKRGALGRRIKCAAVEHKRQPWRHEHITLGIKVAQKRHTELQLAQRVLARLAWLCLVGVVHTAATEGDVVDRKTQRVACGSVRGCLQALHDVVNVVLPFARVGEVQRGRLHRHGVHHRRQTQQRLQLSIHIHPAHAELRTAAVGLGYGQVAHRELQRPGRKFDAPDGDRTAQQCRESGLGLALGNGRHKRPSQHPQQKQRTQRIGQTAQPGQDSGGQWGHGKGKKWGRLYRAGRRTPVMVTAPPEPCTPQSPNGWQHSR